MRTKIAIITHGFTRPGQSCYHSVITAFDCFFDVTWLVIDYGWPEKVTEILDYEEQEAIIFMVGFKHLRRMVPFDWGDFKGKKIMFDFDACQNYGCGIGSSPHKGKWPIIFKRQKFDLLLCTGKKTTDSLNGEGTKTYWIPKAFDGNMFFDKGNDRKKDICFYGRKYEERINMLSFLEQQNILVQSINHPYHFLNSRLNQFKICVVYNGIEPMIKQFEIAASGCVPFCNKIPELFNLDFIDRETMVSYNTFYELADKLIYYLERPKELEIIGKNAARMVSLEHTWEKRMKAIEEIINETIS